MAIVTYRVPAPSALGGAATGSVAATDTTTSTKGTASHPEVRFLVVAAVAIVLGAVLGTVFYDHLSGAVAFSPPTGVGIFALFYIVAQVIERIQEPLTPFLASAPDTGAPAGGGPVRTTQLKAKAALETAFAAA